MSDDDGAAEHRKWTYYAARFGGVFTTFVLVVAFGWLVMWRAILHSRWCGVLFVFWNAL
jgi:hypothetical protein